MRTAERAWRIGRDFAGVLPRAYSAVSAPGDWNPLSLTGARQLGEVVLDELALTGMTLTAPPPKLERTTTSCAAAVGELAGRGVAGVHAEPDSLQISSVRRRRFGRQAGHLFPGGVQEASERFLRGVSRQSGRNPE